jgi:hypothetical protein
MVKTDARLWGAKETDLEIEIYKTKKHIRELVLQIYQLDSMLSDEDFLYHYRVKDIEGFKYDLYKLESERTILEKDLRKLEKEWQKQNPIIVEEID